MSYIAFELDALNVARDVGGAAGIPEERVTHGLLRLWAWCFREKTEHVDAVQVRGFFGVDAAPALMSFGFLEQAGERYRVRGAQRYLRVSEQRKQAGLARSRAAGRSAGRYTSEPPADHQRETSGPPALAPSTEHRAPNTTTAEAVVVREPTEIDGFWRAAQDERTRITGLVREPPPHPRDLSAWSSEAMGEVGGDLKRLWAGYRAFLDDPFWRLDAKTKCAWRGWVSQWRAFLPAAPGAGPPQPRPVKPTNNRSPVAAEAVDWSTVTPGEVQL